ncbi:MAG: hypothetical protein GKR95_07005 [Gammaproteobacteria bacterium]|nr:hypothetical protein [Gammaproteobacteria bacterium]
MAIRVFDTYHASDAEINGVKSVLDNANIHFYETYKGKWGIGSAAIWIKNEDEYQAARAEIEAFELDWKQEVRAQTPARKINWRLIPFAIFIITVVLYLNFSWLY